MHLILIKTNNLNHKYKELIAIEKYRHSYTGRIYSDKHGNNWIKAIISVFARAIVFKVM